MRAESFTAVRAWYLKSKQIDRGTGNYARGAERVITNWLGWCQQRDPPVTSTGGLDVSVLGQWAQSLKTRTHAGEFAGTTAHTY